MDGCGHVSHGHGRGMVVGIVVTCVHLYNLGVVRLAHSGQAPERRSAGVMISKKLLGNGLALAELPCCSERVRGKHTGPAPHRLRACAMGS